MNTEINFKVPMQTSPEQLSTQSYYSGTLIIGPLLGRAKCGQIGKVVTLLRWPGCMPSPMAGQYGKAGQIRKSAFGLIIKVVND